jgi:hypothetical protein
LTEILAPDNDWTLTETPNGELSNNGLTLTVEEDLDVACSRGTIGWLYGVHEWTIRIDGFERVICVGISPSILTLVVRMILPLV